MNFEGFVWGERHWTSLWVSQGCWPNLLGNRLSLASFQDTISGAAGSSDTIEIACIHQYIARSAHFLLVYAVIIGFISV